MTRGAEAIWITGLGAIAPNGVGLPAFTQALRHGRSGLTPTPFQHPHVTSPAVARCADFDPLTVMGSADVKRLPRLIPLALAAAREAMIHAGLTDLTIEQARRVGLILGTGGGGIDFTIEQFAAEARGKSPSLWTITNATHGNLAGELSIRLGLRGLSHCVSTGCASSSDAFGTAMMHLRQGRCDAMVVGGADAHVAPETLWTMELLGVISQGKWDPAHAASRPFDLHRDGFILGEGAWFAVLERASAARHRGATPLMQLAGYASTCDAYHRVRPDPDGEEAVRAIHEALADADLAPRDIGYVHYHGTSTQLNDATETRIVRRAFGAHANALPGSSVKSMIGHPQGACGAAALVATVAALADSDPFLPPTINLDTPDPACDLDYIPHTARPANVDAALINCLAFGAKNTALVVKRA